MSKVSCYSSCCGWRSLQQTWLLRFKWDRGRWNFARLFFRWIGIAWRSQILILYHTVTFKMARCCVQLQQHPAAAR